MNKKLKSILITGSRGIIGSLLIKSLRKKYNIITIDINEVVRNKNTFKIDISNLKKLNSVFNNVGHIDTIIHLAADTNENSAWSSILKNNIIGTKNIYDCALRFGVNRIVFASSTHIFGGYPQYPDKLREGKISVDSLPRPDGFYGISKAFGENIARYYYDLHGIKTINIRIGSLTKNDKPASPYHLIWLSHKDAVKYFEKALESNIKFGTYYAISVKQTIFDTRRLEEY